MGVHIGGLDFWVVSIAESSSVIIAIILIIAGSVIVRIRSIFGWSILGSQGISGLYQEAQYCRARNGFGEG